MSHGLVVKSALPSHAFEHPVEQLPPLLIAPGWAAPPVSEMNRRQTKGLRMKCFKTLLLPDVTAPREIFKVVRLFSIYPHVWSNPDIFFKSS